MPFCRNCGSEVKEESRFCVKCGAPTLPNAQVVSPAWSTQTGVGRSSLSAGSVTGLVVAVVGCFMLVIGPFLPWMTALWVSASGLQKTGNEAIALVILGIVGLASSVVSLILKRRGFTAAPFFVGLVSLALTIFYYVQLHDQLSDPGAEEIGVMLGSGIYLCLVGAIVVIVGAVIAWASQKPRVGPSGNAY